MTDPDPARPEPDLLGLVNVMELIAPGAVARGTTPVAAGLGAAVDRVDVDMPSGATTSFLLRRYLDPSSTDADALREAATLEALRGTPVPAPELLWLDADGDAFGRPALAMTRLPGTSALARLAEDPETVARRLAEAVVTVSWVPAVVADHLPRLVEPLALADWYLDASHVEDGTVGDGSVLTGMRERLESLGTTVPTLSHGDLHAGNVLLDGDGLAGVLDWDRAAVADPRADLAYAAVSLALAAGVEAGAQVLEHHAGLKGETDDLAPFVLLALARALPDPDRWLPAWTAHGLVVTADEARSRWHDVADAWT